MVHREGTRMTEPQRDRVLTVFAVLFAVLAVSNLLKPLEIGATTGFVLLGRRLSGTPNAIAGPLFGLYLLVYAAGIWRLRRHALPMAWAYAGYVVLNLILFRVHEGPPPTPGYGLFTLVYGVVAIGVSAGAAVLLSRRRTELT
jgi:hypothetical protein